jgi:hypothetical protein
MFLGSRPASGNRIGTATWPYNAHPVLLKNYAGPGDKDGTPTNRPSGFPETGAFLGTKTLARKQSVFVDLPSAST